MHKSRKPIIAGNWKMHGTQAMTADLLNIIKNKVSADVADVIVFPPFIFLPQTQQLLQGSNVQWGGQNMAAEKSGAFTGEISGEMLLEFGCRYVLLGHSERRSLFGEEDLLIAKKFKLALELGLQPILCVGETLQQREQGLTEEVVAAQLLQVAEYVGGMKLFENAILAYEPVWAIGTGKTATPEQAQAAHAFLRQQVASQSKVVADGLRILYGGSVKAANANSLFAMPDIDGGLIGGASLDAEEFLQIYQSIKNS